MNDESYGDRATKLKNRIKIGALAVLTAGVLFAGRYFYGEDKKVEVVRNDSIEKVGIADIGQDRVYGDNEFRTLIREIQEGNATGNSLEEKVDVYSMNDAEYETHIRTKGDYAFGLMRSYLDSDELRDTLGREYFVQTVGEYIEALNGVPFDEIMKYTPQSFWKSHPELFEEINNFEVASNPLESIIKIPDRSEIESLWTPKVRESFARMRESELLGGYSESLPHLANLGNFDLSTNEEGNVDGVSRQYEEFVLDSGTTHEIALDKFEKVFDYLKRTGLDGELLDGVKEEIELYRLQEGAVNGVSTKHNYAGTIEEKWEMDEKLEEFSAGLNNAFSKVFRSRLENERKNFKEHLGTGGRRVLALKELCEGYYNNKENAELSQMSQDE